MHIDACTCICVCTYVKCNVERVVCRMNPVRAHSHVIVIHVIMLYVKVYVYVCICICMRNSNKNLKTSLRKRKPLRREQRWAERGRRLGIRLRRA